jgi:hypothetical protein
VAGRWLQFLPLTAGIICPAGLITHCHRHVAAQTEKRLGPTMVRSDCMTCTFGCF